MAKHIKVIGDEAYNTIVSAGHSVPRDNKKDIIPFRVGGEYWVTCPSNTTAIRVRCTQDCPYSLMRIEDPKN